jgi:O-Glycosyl hydrolase
MKIINFRKTFLSCISLALACGMQAQSYTWISSSEGNYWKQNTVKLQKKVPVVSDLEVNNKDSVATFKAWGTCFNELGWDALNMLSTNQKENILKQLFSPNGEMHFTIGRLSMNANDYARNWYSCDEVDGDFQLKQFNIERDKQALIPYIKSAQKYNPDMTFWISPWSPPNWMKINHHYANKSGKFNDLPKEKEVPLYENDQVIQDSRYLQAYALYFCKFIDAYKEQGIPITTVMYQNEAYSFTEYPGCSWTADGTIRFNSEYLAPTLAKLHPEVELFLGTINTNHLDVIEKILSDSKMQKCIKGVGFQWEGGQILPKIRAKYPNYSYVQSESECGWGKFDWSAAEHTFGLINHYLSNGCEKYTFWNAILCDKGMSSWGWSQNALIRVDSQTKTATYTPEYYAVKHYSHYVIPGSRLLGYKESAADKKAILIFLTPQNKYVVIAGNFNNGSQRLTLKLGERYLDVTLAAHSFNTFQMK